MKYEIVSERKNRSPVKVSLPSDVYTALTRYAYARQEQFILITLNTTHEIISISIVSIGTVNQTIVHPREVFIRAIKDFASAVIIAHNHPSGNTDVSCDDIAVTRKLQQAGEIIGIPVIDHIIISGSKYLSFSEEGLMPQDVSATYGE